jgi:predicted ATPase
VSGEATYFVPSLSLPDPRRLPPLDDLKQLSAVQLFVDRAVSSQPNFALSSSNAAPVAQICHRLDGIPLAIELAAARVKVLSPEQIATRLDDRFRLLTGGARTALPRQQTLRALIDWSYDLLDEPEKALLSRLAVFAGGWTLEAAEAVCADETLESWEVLDLLSHLVDKSLVIVDEALDGGDSRYRLLQTVRQYALEKLREADGADAANDRHRDWFLGMAEAAEPELQGAGQKAALNRMEAEYDNLRGALDRALQTTPEPALRAAGRCGVSGRSGATSARAATGWARSSPAPTWRRRPPRSGRRRCGPPARWRRTRATTRRRGRCSRRA